MKLLNIPRNHGIPLIFVINKMSVTYILNKMKIITKIKIISLHQFSVFGSEKLKIYTHIYYNNLYKQCLKEKTEAGNEIISRSKIHR